MALVQYGSEKIDTRFGKMYSPTFYDTDDLDDLSYHYYRKAESLKNIWLAKKILTGIISGRDIEENPEKYSSIID